MNEVFDVKKLTTLLIFACILFSVIALGACSNQTDEVLKKNGDSYTKLPLQSSTTKGND